MVYRYIIWPDLQLAFSVMVLTLIPTFWRLYSLFLLSVTNLRTCTELLQPYLHKQETTKTSHSQAKPRISKYPTRWGLRSTQFINWFGINTGRWATLFSQDQHGTWFKGLKKAILHWKIASYSMTIAQVAWESTNYEVIKHLVFYRDQCTTFDRLDCSVECYSIYI